MIAVLLALAGVGFYAAVCWLKPYSICLRCYAEGKVGGKKCRRCKGTGRRLRRGRRVWNYYAARRREAK